MACSALNASEQAYQTAAAQAASKDEEIGRLQASLAEANTDRERLRSRVQTLSNTEAELHVLRVEARRALSALAHAQESDRTQQAAVLAAAEAETARLHAALTASTAEREQLASLLHMSRFDYERLASLSASSESAAGSAGIRVQQLQGQLAEAEAARTREVDELNEKLKQAIHERGLYKDENEGLRGLAADARQHGEAILHTLVTTVASLTTTQEDKKRLESDLKELQERLRQSVEQAQLLKEDGLRQDRELQEQVRRHTALTASTAQAVASAFATAQAMQKGKEDAQAQSQLLQVELQALRARMSGIESEAQRDMASMRESLQQVEGEKEGYRVEVERVKAQLQQAQETTAAAHRDAADARSNLARLQQEVMDLRGQHHHALAQIQLLTEQGAQQAKEWEEQVQQHEEIYANVEKRLASFYAQCEAAEADRDAAVLKYAQVCAENESLELQLAAAESATEGVEALRAQLQAREALIGSLTGQIQELQRKVVQFAHEQAQVRALTGPPILPDNPSVQDFLLHLKKLGLKSAQLVIGVDCTKSNLWSGKQSNNGRSLHDVSDTAQPTPYQRIMATLGRALKDFDDDGMIPLYGFGCSRTQEHSVFSFKPGEEACMGVEDALEVYRTVIPTVKLDGPTSFAPLIKKTVEIVKRERQFTVLLIIADGQVTAVKETEAAIVEASKYPIAIITVGVGDGPWEEMHRFDDALPHRKIDNFQFIEYLQTVQEAVASGKDVDAHFILSALGELPDMITSMKKVRMLPDK